MLRGLIGTERLNVHADKQTRCREDTSHEIPAVKNSGRIFRGAEQVWLNLLEDTLVTNRATVVKGKIPSEVYEFGSV
jgi:hypothetical protein